MTHLFGRIPHFRKYEYLPVINRYYRLKIALDVLILDFNRRQLEICNVDTIINPKNTIRCRKNVSKKDLHFFSITYDLEFDKHLIQFGIVEKFSKNSIEE